MPQLIPIYPDRMLPNEQLSLWQFEQNHQEEVAEWLRNQLKITPDRLLLIQNKVFSELRLVFQREKHYQKQAIWEVIHKIAERDFFEDQHLMDKNFGLSELQFNKLVDDLQDGDDQLYEQVFLKHFGDCLTYLSRTYQAAHEDAYDATMDAMLEFCKRLKQGKIRYGNLRFLFTRMAGQIYFKSRKQSQKTEELSDIDIADATEKFDEETLMMLDKAWTSLCSECQALLRMFYYDDIPLTRIAELSEKSAVAVRKQKQRCIEKLRISFEKLI